MLPCPPDAARHSTEVSDTQSVSSHSVMPPEAASEYDDWPRLVPWSVTLEDPVSGELEVRTALAASSWAVKASDALLAPSPAVNVMRRLAGDPRPTFADNAVSDAHMVSSHADHPAEAVHVRPLAPRCAPCTVTIAAPDAGLFRVPARLALTESIVKPSDVLPTCDPADMATALLTTMPWPTLLHTDVSDAHMVRSLAVIPIMVPSVTAAMPIFIPCTVMPVDPV
jgi:hypothetical protein